MNQSFGWNIIWIRISAGSRRWTSWLFTSLVKDFNSGLPWANPVSGQGRTLNLAPPDYMSSTLTPWPPDFFTLKSGWGGGMMPFRGLVSLKWLLLTLEPSRVSSVGAACKVSPNWLQETVTCHSSHCFSIVWGQGNTPLVACLPSSCYVTPLKYWAENWRKLFVP